MMEEQQRWNSELENRVRAKTAELQSLCDTRDYLLRRILRAQEDERRRVARELHDETSQSLTALIANLATAQAQVPAQAYRQLSDFKMTVVNILKEVNRIVLDLRPTLLDDYGLVAALSWYAKNRLGEDRLQIDLSADVGEKRFNTLIETTLFRVGQEAITNIAKHADAQHVQIRLALESDDHALSERLVLTIQDDGCGFQMQSGKPVWAGTEAHLGLLGMRERVESLGGLFVLWSEPGQGTLVCASVPLAGKIEEGGSSA
jgi:signal transduction histidine kinase